MEIDELDLDSMNKLSKDRKILSGKFIHGSNSDLPKLRVGWIAVW